MLGLLIKWTLSTLDHSAPLSLCHTVMPGFCAKAGGVEYMYSSKKRSQEVLEVGVVDDFNE